MSSAIITFPPPRAQAPFVRKDGTIDLQALQNLLGLYYGADLQTVDTHAGPTNFGVPLAQFNQNAERIYVKTSTDANVPTLLASGSDKINGATSQAMGTAQYSKMRLKSDGVSNWYIVG